MGARRAGRASLGCAARGPGVARGWRPALLKPGRRYPGAVRLTVFWEKLRGQFGEAYAASVAKDYVLAGLGGATVNQALAAGKEPKTVWLAVCEAFDIPEEAR